MHYYMVIRNAHGFYFGVAHQCRNKITSKQHLKWSLNLVKVHFLILVRYEFMVYRLDTNRRKSGQYNFYTNEMLFRYSLR